MGDQKNHNTNVLLHDDDPLGAVIIILAKYGLAHASEFPEGSVPLFPGGFVWCDASIHLCMLSVVLCLSCAWREHLHQEQQTQLRMACVCVCACFCSSSLRFFSARACSSLEDEAAFKYWSHQIFSGIFKDPLFGPFYPSFIHLKEEYSKGEIATSSTVRKAYLTAAGLLTLQTGDARFYRASTLEGFTSVQMADEKYNRFNLRLSGRKAIYDVTRQLKMNFQEAHDFMFETFVPAVFNLLPLYEGVFDMLASTSNPALELLTFRHDDLFSTRRHTWVRKHKQDEFL